jgi:hypothetical protein
MANITADVAVWGDHWCAINAAIEAARYGRRAVLFAPTHHFGTPVVAGLGLVDLGSYGSRNLGNWTNREFYNRLSKFYGAPTYTLTRPPPSVAESIWSDMLRDYGVLVVPDVGITSVASSANQISSVALSNGHTIVAASGSGINFVDGDEDGDLARKAGVPLIQGREGTSTYGESLAGYQPHPETFVACDTSDGAGGLISGIWPDPGLAVGAADLGSNQMWGWRTSVTNNYHNRRPWPKPSGYDPTLFTYLVRTAGGNFASDNFRPFGVGGVVAQGKVDVNNDTGIWQNEYQTATDVRRAAILKLMEAEWYGWIWYCATQGSNGCQQFLDEWGPCLDEFVEGTPTAAGLPNTFYRRGTSRLANADYILTQHDLQESPTKARVIATGYYSLDAHISRRVATAGGFFYDTLGYAGTGPRAVTPGYHIPSDVMFQPTITNLAVPNCHGASFVAYASTRIDNWKANMGSVAGYMAAKSIGTATPMRSLDITAIQSETVALGNVIAASLP